MRTLFLLRGLPGVGKSTWIKENGLEPYTLSADEIRLMYQSPVMNLEGQEVISQKNDSQTWKTLMELLEMRMARGEFCVVDATHYKSELIARYKKLVSKYRYRSYVIDFTKVPLETVLERNKQRASYKFVPEDAIKKMYAVFEEEEGKGQVIAGFDVVTPEQAIDIINNSLLFDFNKYEKVVVFGDIHGCYEPLKTYFSENPFDSKNFYIFVGDYLDRGVQNKEVLEFLISLKDNKNVLLLTGNHEKHIINYSNDGYKPEKLADYLTVPMYQELIKDISSFKMTLRCIKGVLLSLIEFNPQGYKEVFNNITYKKIKGLAKKYGIKVKEKFSPEFISNTLPQIEGVDRKEISRLCQRFGQFAYFSYGENVYLVTHGGISNLPSIFTATDEYIKGVGKYEDTEELYASWLKNTPENYIQIHGHRNIFKEPIKVNDRIYNLNSSIEYGEDLRCIEISQSGIKELSIKNPVFAEKPSVAVKKKYVVTKTKNELIQELNKNKHIDKKKLDDEVISYNFGRDAFRKGIWNDFTVRARGLFIDSLTDDVVARGYSKFFNYDEVEETKSKSLVETLKFPLVGYKKENGFLGLVSWNRRADKPFISSKSQNTGDYADMVRENFEKLELKQDILDYAKDNNVTFIFECIDEKDPHIIRYHENKLVLLDIVKNELEDKFLPYDELVRVAEMFKLPVKQKELEFSTWEEFYKFKKQQDVSYDCRHEGWVFVDSENFRFKYKSRFYKFWKYMRSIKDSMAAERDIRKIFSSEVEVRVYNFMKKKGVNYLKNHSIIDVQEEFYKTTKI